MSDHFSGRPHDHLRSTRIVLSPDVVPILSRTDYEPFGRPLQTQSPANPQRLSWIGKENDVALSIVMKAAD